MEISRITSPTSLCLQDLSLHRITTSITVATLFALASVAMAGNPRYKVSCDPAVPAAYQASMKAFEKKNCGDRVKPPAPGARIPKDTTIRSLLALQVVPTSARVATGFQLRFLGGIPIPPQLVNTQSSRTIKPQPERKHWDQIKH
ncbi:uncharacterized protein CLUP02_09301 [Colletotrichum lupini]|uniref:Uncharacterized protein n=1 Tax=Colletotrichum lupini TaxID=145971 RepID=A0A9Q8SUN8_9PEZI|nr:uncharacterized protein CLUP02_09301 [Colletotrichum lupini]UQC83805.1 hypothetical protein CLUP02_09301 [Colletotrichum lupini]